MSNGAAAFTPPSISGNILWLRADLGITLISGKVSAWADQSTGGHNFTQGVAGNRPVISSAAINGKDAVSFTATDPDFMTSAISAPSAGEVFVVVTVVGTLQNGLWTIGSSGSGELYPFGSGSGGDGNIYEDWGSTARIGPVSPGVALSSAHVYNVQSAANLYKILIDGTQVYTSASNTVGFSATWTIGKDVAAIGHHGLIAEVIVYNSVLGSTDRASVMSYLRGRYATP